MRTGGRTRSTGFAALLSLSAPLVMACAGESGDAARQGDSPAAGIVTIEYIAHAAFLITSPEGTTALVDPYQSRWWLGYDFPAGSESPTAALLSHPHPDHDAGHASGAEVPWGESTAVLTSPGQYVFEDLQVFGIRGRHAPPYGEEFGRRNTIWLLETGGLRIAHIGDNGPVTEEVAEALGRVDIMMLPVDDAEHILTHDEVAEWRARLGPRVVVPMHYRHDDLEVDPESPGDLASIDAWLSRQIDFGRLESNQVALTPADLPPAPRIWVFPHSPEVAAPVGTEPR